MQMYSTNNIIAYPFSINTKINECYIYTFSSRSNDTADIEQCAHANAYVSLFSIRNSAIVKHTNERNVLTNSNLWLEGAKTSIYHSFVMLWFDIRTLNLFCSADRHWLCTTNCGDRIGTSLSPGPAFQNKRAGTCQAQIVFWHKLAQ